MSRLRKECKDCLKQRAIYMRKQCRRCWKLSQRAEVNKILESTRDD